MKKLLILIFVIICLIAGEAGAYKKEETLSISVKTIPVVKISVKPITLVQPRNHCFITKPETCNIGNINEELPIFLEEVKRRKEEKRLEEERVYQEYLASLPRTINFNDYYSLVNITGLSLEERQAYVDAGYLTNDAEDYFHHNTAGFMNIFSSIRKGDYVILGSKKFKATLFEYATVYDDRYVIGDTTGIDAWLDGSPDLITCYGGPGTLRRQIWHLEEV